MKLKFRKFPPIDGGSIKCFCGRPAEYVVEYGGGWKVWYQLSAKGTRLDLIDEEEDDDDIGNQKYICCDFHFKEFKL